MMEKTRFLLIGGGLAAVSAVRQLAACDPEASISIVNNEAYPPYDRPPLSKGFLAGSVTLSDLAHGGLDKLSNLKIRSNHVVALDPAAHIASPLRKETVSYEKCLIATGGRPRLARVRGTHPVHPRAFQKHAHSGGS
jgi:3-phenylpropionate/trans-cinnamate dioxygenase ferredoxin reductase component